MNVLQPDRGCWMGHTNANYEARGIANNTYGDETAEVQLQTKTQIQIQMQRKIQENKKNYFKSKCEMQAKR